MFCFHFFWLGLFRPSLILATFAHFHSTMTYHLCRRLEAGTTTTTRPTEEKRGLGFPIERELIKKVRAKEMKGEGLPEDYNNIPDLWVPSFVFIFFSLFKVLWTVRMSFTFHLWLDEEQKILHSPLAKKKRKGNWNSCGPGVFRHRWRIAQRKE